MKIYFAGIPAGWIGHVDWIECERVMNELGLQNRLMSYHYLYMCHAIIEFAKKLEEERRNS